MDEQTNKQGQKKVMIVEDDVALAEIYSTILQAEGFAIKHVPNGKEALSAALDFHPDLVLLDIMMPDMNGFDVLLLLRGEPQLANLKVVMLSALDGDIFIEKAKQLKADDYFTKSKVKTSDVVDRIKVLTT